MKNKNMLFIGILLGILILIILIPIIINKIYIDGMLIDFANTVFEPNDLLNYISIVLSLLGTFLLGLIAICQNIKLYELEKRILDKDGICNSYLTKSLDQTFPKHAFSLNDKMEIPKRITLWFKITNYGNSFLKKVKISIGNFYIESEITIAINDSKEVIIYIPDSYVDKELLQIEFISVFDISTYGTFGLCEEDRETNLFSIVNYHFYGIRKYL